MQTIYRVGEKYLCNLQRAMNYVEDLANQRANRYMKSYDGCNEKNIASCVKRAWRKSQKGLSYVVEWEQNYKKHSASAKLIFINMDDRAEWSFE